MRVMVLIKADTNTEAGVMPSEELLRQMGTYNEALVNAGIMLAGEGLHPSSKGARVRFSGAERSVLHGPFAERLIAGFWLWRVPSMEEAIEWVKRCPNPTGAESEIEIRRVFEADDFGAELTPELRAQEERLRAEAERQGGAGPSIPNNVQGEAMDVQAYLFFEGRCEEAIEFYRNALGAEVTMLMRYKDSPEPLEPGMIPPGSENRVMHASVRIGNTTVMASDGSCAGQPGFRGFSLSITPPDAAAADRLFAALADGGQVQMPLAKTFWSPRFGMVADRFGVGWMINVAA